MGIAADDIGTGPTVVLLHGQPGAASMWHAVVARLRERCRLIVPDRPGYGRTRANARGFAGNADAIVELLDQRELSSATVVGHSWGGGVALTLAVRHPDRVDGLVLISSIGPRSALLPLDRVLTWPAVGPALAFAGLGVMRRVFPPRWLGAPLDGSDGSRPHLGRRAWRSFLVEQRAMVRGAAELDATIERVASPVTVLFGDRDRVVPSNSARELAARIPESELIAVARGGHLLPQQRADVIADAIARRAGAASDS